MLASYDWQLRYAGLIVSAAIGEARLRYCFHLFIYLEEGSEDLLSCIDYAERVREIVKVVQ